MLLEELKKADLKLIFAQIPRKPQYLMTLTSMKIFLSDYPLMYVRYFRYSAERDNADQLWICALHDKRANWIHVHFCCALDTVISDAEFDSIFSEFRQQYPPIVDNPNQLLYGSEFIMKKFFKWSNDASYDLHPTHAYYLAEAEIAKLKNFEVKLPEGFHFAEPNLEADSAEIVEKIDPYSIPQDQTVQRAKLEHLPSVLVRETSTSKLAGCYLLDPRGILHLQFTYPRHRRLGIGHALELRLLKNCVDYGIPSPTKTILLDNERLIENHKYSKIWTRWDDGSGNPVIFLYATRK